MNPDALTGGFDVPPPCNPPVPSAPCWRRWPAPERSTRSRALCRPPRFRIGQPDYPDRSATLIIEVDRLTNHGATLTGPGIETATWLSLSETAAFAAIRARFPLGFDCLFTVGSRLAGLPRSTRVEVL